MQSFNKSKLDDNQLKDIMDHAFGQSIQSSEELTEGWANVAYEIVLADGRKVVLKVAPSKDKRLMRCEKNNMRTEVEALRIVTQIGGIPVPHVYVYDPSCTLIDSEYFIMEYIEGISLNKIKDSLLSEELQSIEKQLGEYNALINSCKGEKFGYFHDGDDLTVSWAVAFRKLINDVLQDGIEAGIDLSISYSEIEIEIDKRITTLNEVSEPCLVHWDLWPGNVFIHEGRISGIIDFERAFWGDPLIEYYFGKFAQSAAFEEGYGKGITSEGERNRRALYDFYLDLVMVIECDYRQYENQEHIQWAFRNFEEGFNKFKKHL
ncbi:aminoglycoside phosphotransferase family protein [Paenibacillus crassostreae]|uniref:Protein kinase domain-containing protein n=1 Tax=Paenibacillus crassostreae TaxID=1763538 RepID=A0A167FI08_9BACL|nr:aminoglycoside phosphotransferase family protein [Paenibacillus crassostreae]AOZ94385.1 hypothetical protein LPB68_20715 [Paenibacillus crassostreae]OAB76578.1 hypothetical protein PNBC_04025 [Paenibacillus crassostreae]